MKEHTLVTIVLTNCSIILQTRDMKLPVLEKAKVFGKTVFLRADLDIPLSAISNQQSAIRGIEDDTRLKAGLPTIEYLLKNGAKIIIAGHLGRPKGFDKSLSLEPVAKWFNCHPEFISGSRSSGDEMPKQVRHNMTKTKLGEFDGWELSNNLFLLENLRFYEGEENPTTASGLEFARKLANLADIYVNDAFAVCHRNHASITGVPKYLPHFAGIHLQEEIRVLSSVLENPNRPLVVIIGGAKIETKLPLVEKMRDFADFVLVGGKIAKELTEILKAQNQKVKKRKATLLVADLNQDGFDITPKSVDDFLQIINLAKTVVWNGPIGQISNLKSQISNQDSEYGTLKLAEGIIKSKTYSIVGGGDTVGFLKNYGFLDKFSFVSTGGGAMLEFLSGKKLPGLAILS